MKGCSCSCTGDVRHAGEGRRQTLAEKKVELYMHHAIHINSFSSVEKFSKVDVHTVYLGSLAIGLSNTSDIGRLEI